jgi:predicted secreted protein
MAAEAGRKVRIEYSANGTDWNVIAGARTDGITINNEMIDATDKDDAGVRTLINDIGVQSFAMSCEGVLKDTTLSDLALNTTEDAALHDLRINIGALGTFTGTWFIPSFEISGAEGAEVMTFTASFESSGAVTFA